LVGDGLHVVILPYAISALEGSFYWIFPPPAGVDRANTDDEGAERFDAALVEDLYTLGANRGDCQSGEKGSGAEDRRGSRGEDYQHGIYFS
jgi:hypothetical protein